MWSEIYTVTRRVIIATLFIGLCGYLFHLTHVSGTANFRVTFNTDKEISEIVDTMPSQATGDSQTPKPKKKPPVSAAKNNTILPPPKPEELQ